MSASDIILTTANARYSHCSFALRRLWAALGPLRDCARILEFTIQQDACEIAETLLRESPRVIGIGVYIWNVALMTQVVQILRAVRPEIRIVAGGPEVMPGAPFMEAVHHAVVGEGESAFAALAATLLSGDGSAEHTITPAPPNLDLLPTPYEAYTDEDIRQRMVYVESSRGCPYRCAFCLSSRDERVRYFPLQPFLTDMACLLERGVRQFKFTDRTFNLSNQHAHAILQFFLARDCSGLRLHFEIMPDRLDDETIALMSRFAPGQLHLEVGVQSVNPETQRRMGRNQDMDKTFAAVRRLRRETGALIHADLIIGLPGDAEADIAEGFNMLVATGVDEIQVGLLKRLRGTAMTGPLGRELRFDGLAPYEVLQTPTLRFERIQELKRLARYFDLYYNRGNFPESLPLLWQSAPTCFAAFTAFADFLWRCEQRTHKIPLERLAQRLHEYLISCEPHHRDTVNKAIEADYRRLPGRKDKLLFLKD